MQNIIDMLGNLIMMSLGVLSLFTLIFMPIEIYQILKTKKRTI